MNLKCLHAASEVAGFAKTGGLADVAAALPPALTANHVDCAVVMPLYRACRTAGRPIEPTELRFRIPIGGQAVEGRLWRSTLPGSKVPIYLIEQADFFERDDPGSGRGIYQYTDAAGQRVDYGDNSARFAFFARGILEVMRLINFWPDVLHLHDWQTGLTGAFLRETYQRFGKPELRSRYQSIRTVFTIHNLAYQGVFWHLDMPVLGLPWSMFAMDKLEFHGKINFLKAGLVYADALTTVSPTYAREIQTTLLGCGLHGVLMERNHRLYGIVNGIDDQIWNPATDSHLAAKYGPDDIAGKVRCKAALQTEFKLDVDAKTPLLGVVSRLAMQKGFDLLEAAVPAFVRAGAQLVVLGDGDKVYREMLLKMREEFPDKVGLSLDISEPLAHRIEAGADIFLMPSRYEPCGLNQLYSLKYGTVPVVRATGGLADTVVDATPTNLATGLATGFAFVAPTPAAFAEALQRAITTYHDEPDVWRQIQQTGMAQDWSWRRSAVEYERIYRKVVQGI